ncbi:hypothetical protein niasHT_007147 [Heterodera trifolii]|uniref:Uncharacterized protein n=1 Tax=Heterodera trifolii TaxID=157864 RepID=A0ABD2LKT3_9BILA
MDGRNAQEEVLGAVADDVGRDRTKTKWEGRNGWWKSGGAGGIEEGRGGREKDYDDANDASQRGRRGQSCCLGLEHSHRPESAEEAPPVNKTNNKRKGDGHPTSRTTAAAKAKGMTGRGTDGQNCENGTKTTDERWDGGQPVPSLSLSPRSRKELITKTKTAFLIAME